MTTLKNKRVFVAGHNGMVGSALVRRLAEEECTILTAERSELDLKRQEPVEQWFKENKPDYVFLAAAKVGGILANSQYPVDFLADNLAIQSNVIQSAASNDVKKLLFLGSSCIYPKFAKQPIRENELLEGQLEPTNEWYAIAKIAGIKLCQAYREQYRLDFISAMPTNLYGPGDNYHPEDSHVLASLIRKFCEAVEHDYDTVDVWGTGTPLREFLHVDDCADGLVFLMNHYNGHEHVNLGSGAELSIAELANLIAELCGYTKGYEFDTTIPDGTPRKLMDSSKINKMGWKPKIPLRKGIKHTINEYRKMRAFE
ncbi:MAG: GDP-L-fucose synthase [Rhodobacteraceae bacterium]|nr:GDP-L-fucose synthase [Paracoccaceae bacterium]